MLKSGQSRKDLNSKNSIGPRKLDQYAFKLYGKAYRNSEVYPTHRLYAFVSKQDNS